jgi:hypothetical protein
MVYTAEVSAQAANQTHLSINRSLFGTHGVRAIQSGSKHLTLSVILTLLIPAPFACLPQAGAGEKEDLVFPLQRAKKVTCSCSYEVEGDRFASDRSEPLLWILVLGIRAFQSCITVITG